MLALDCPVCLCTFEEPVIEMELCFLLLPPSRGILLTGSYPVTVDRPIIFEDFCRDLDIDAEAEMADVDMAGFNIFF